MPIVFWSNLALEGFLGGYLVLACCGIFYLLKRGAFSIDWLILALVGLYLLVLSGGPMALNRFRVPLMPCISLLVGVGGGWLMTKERQKQIPTVIGGTIAVPKPQA